MGDTDTSGSKLSCENMWVQFAGADIASVHGVSLAAQAGQIHAIIGESGAGKSTILNAFAGFLDVQSGDIVMDGRLLSGAGRIHVKTAQRAIAYVFQDPALFPHLNLAENICFGLKKTPKRQRHEIAKSWLERFGLSGRETAFPHEISGGEAQRVAIARALAYRPKAILLDEPFSNLNAALRAEIQGIVFREIRAANIPCFWVTHAPADAMQFADRISVLKAGKLLQTDSPLALNHQPQHLQVLKAISEITTMPAKDWPQGLLGFTPSANTGDIAVRVNNIAFVKDGYAVKLLEKRIAGDRIKVKITASGVVFDVYAPLYKWDDLIEGETLHVQLPPSSVFHFP